MTSVYAKGSDVPADRSRNEIEKTLERYGATSFFYATEGDKAIIGFRAHERVVRFSMPLPPVTEFMAYKTSVGNMHGSFAVNKTRTREEALKVREQALRQKWRCLALAVKAKLEVVESGIASFEDEFLAHITMPDGRTVGETVRPRLIEAYKSGRNIPLLPEATT